MSTLAKIIYEETGLTQSGTPGEYEEVASACRRFALCCDPRRPLTDEAELQCPCPQANPSTREAWLDGWEAAERAHGIGSKS